jgi:hypothetical protein
MATITRIRADAGTRIDTAHEGEPDRATVTANGIVVDVIANEDGTVYVECYAAKAGGSVTVDAPNLDNRHPNVTLALDGGAA